MLKIEIILNLLLDGLEKPLPGRVTTELFYLSVGDEVLLGEPTGDFC